ncbi:MAG: STAS domain-containing protein [Nitrospirales bacterium]|nr:STAS domain-containing protein [Nitrospirales bacterium]
MSEVTILRMGAYLIVPIQVELHDRAAIALQQNILLEIERTAAKGLIIDVSAISVVDSFLGRLLGELAHMAALMGVDTVLVGLRKEVVITLVELGFVLKGIYTALNIEEGLERLQLLNAGKDEAFD